MEESFKRKSDVSASYLLDVESLVFGRQSKVRDNVEGNVGGEWEWGGEKEERK